VSYRQDNTVDYSSPCGDYQVDTHHVARRPHGMVARGLGRCKKEEALISRLVIETRLLPPMSMLLKGCEADWVDDLRAGRRHIHRERS